MLAVVTPELPNSGEIQIQIVHLVPSSFLIKPLHTSFIPRKYLCLCFDINKSIRKRNPLPVSQAETKRPATSAECKVVFQENVSSGYA